MNPEESSEQLRAHLKEIDQTRKPIVDAFLEDLGIEQKSKMVEMCYGAVIQRFKDGSLFWVQTDRGVLSVSVADDGRTFNVNSTKIESWLPEARLPEKKVGLIIKGGEVKGDTVISGVHVGRSGVRVDEIKMEKVNDITFSVPGGRLTISRDQSGLKFNAL